MQLRGIIYIDSLFLLNLVMDLYLLLLTANILGKTTTYLRIFAVSAVGAGGYCLVLCLPGIPYIFRTVFGMIPIGALMIKTACRTKGMRELFYALGILFTLSFVTGGFILFLRGQSRMLTEYGDSFTALSGMGFAVCAAGKKWIEAHRRKRRNYFCKVSFSGDEGPVEVNALIDTGNGLTEPVSRKPVAILDEESWKELKMWMRPEKYKLIPYHSIGKKRGLLEGYEIDTMKVKGNETEKQYDKVIVAIFKGKLSAKGSYQMILPPELAI